MGNCLFGGMGDLPGNEVAIKVTTSNGGVMEFFPPITAGRIAGEFPGHALFRSRDLFWKPLPDADDLLPGSSYHLLPLAREGHVRSASLPGVAATQPYRMSFDSSRRTDAFPRPYRKQWRSSAAAATEFWKVRLVISPEQLLEILSQEGRTQELIDNVRTVAKCGDSTSRAATASEFSDQWSLSNSSSRNGSSKLLDGLN